MVERNILSMRRICKFVQWACTLLNPPLKTASPLHVGQLFHQQPLLLINAHEAEDGRGGGEEVWRNRRFKKERQEYCILLRAGEKRVERKETCQGELFL